MTNTEQNSTIFLSKTVKQEASVKNTDKTNHLHTETSHCILRASIIHVAILIWNHNLFIHSLMCIKIDSCNENALHIKYMLRFIIHYITSGTYQIYIKIHLSIASSTYQIIYNESLIQS